MRTFVHDDRPVRDTVLDHLRICPMIRERGLPVPGSYRLHQEPQEGRRFRRVLPDAVRYFAVAFLEEG